MDSPLTPHALRIAGQDHALEPERQYVLGSAPDCDLQLGGNGAAAHHARLHFADGRWTVQDLGSPSGTWRNGERIEQVVLEIGDVLRIGDGEALIVPDHGAALIVPLPEFRAAARERRFAAVRIAAGQLRDENNSFQEMVAQELRRTPWFAASALIHLLLLILLWLWLPNRQLAGRTEASVEIDFDATLAALGEDRPPQLEVTIEHTEDPITPDPATSHDVPDVAPAEPDVTFAPAPGNPTSNPRISAQSSKPASRGSSTGSGALQNLGSGSFRKAVGDLRRTGLEIVFVFDSTGSMSRTILDTKRSISQMLSVLRALVPDARVALVTYRDRGPREEYLVRSMPLGPDFWRASNFVQFVNAGGGGDRPEDVRAGLDEAFAQPWKESARRVVILAGDAPPHDEDYARLLSEVRAFARNGRSFVHALVTSPESAGDDTQKRFTEIATAGHGVCLDMEKHDKVMQRVLTLAFGREYDADIATVIKAIEQSAERTETWALDLARRGGQPLAEALRKAPVEYALLNALVRLPHRRVALQLVEMLGDKDVPSQQRQAIAWVLQRVLDLPLPPVDPVDDVPLHLRGIARLRRLADRLPE